ncbi:MAG TPA: hypothetical protein VGX92_17645 [Pyrinomonadaceae bacterium]|jgi:hypothetical protein|nr:hypothetical protein [Pyrinomonadaceae bacterium]
MTNNNTIEVHFMHPRKSGELLTADISPHCTGHEALQGLMTDDGTGAFLVAPPNGQVYELALKRTDEAITPNMTFMQAGVIDGDTVEVRLAGQGAGA